MQEVQSWEVPPRFFRKFGMKVDIYHDSEHSCALDQTAYGEPLPGGETAGPSNYNAFADLNSLIKVKK